MRHNPAFLRLVEGVRQNIRECGVETVKEKLAQKTECVVLDVREDHEVQGGIIPGALHLGRGILERDVEMKIPEKATEIVLYCGGGYRSALAADSLQKMGYTNVWSMEGGMKAWKAAGFPLKETETGRRKS